MTDFTKVCIIFEANESILSNLLGKSNCWCEIYLAIFPEANIYDRIDDKFVVGIPNSYYGPHFKSKACL